MSVSSLPGTLEEVFALPSTLGKKFKQDLPLQFKQYSRPLQSRLANRHRLSGEPRGTQNDDTEMF